MYRHYYILVRINLAIADKPQSGWSGVYCTKCDQFIVVRLLAL